MLGVVLACQDPLPGPASRYAWAMLTPLDIALWASAILLLLASLWWARPRPVELDWERFFKLSLVTLLRGPIESREGSAEEWLALGRARVWFNPAGRDPFTKLTDPQPDRLPVPALPGERSLTERLAAVSITERAGVLYGEGADESLYEDPQSLGPDWDLRRYLGAGLDWDGLADATEPLKVALGRKAESVVWVSLSLTDLHLSLSELLPRCVLLDEDILSQAEPEALATEIDAAGPGAADRFVLMAAGEHVGALLRCLEAYDGLRDRVLAVVVLDPHLAQEQDWLAEHFTHKRFDTELSRPTGWFQLRFLRGDTLDPGLPEPPELETGREGVERVDLGLLPGTLSDQDPQWLARALAVTVLAWVGSRG